MFVFVPEDYDLELFKKYHAWKITSTMTVRKYTKGFRTIATRLNSIEMRWKRFIVTSMV